MDEDKRYTDADDPMTGVRETVNGETDISEDPVMPEETADDVIIAQNEADDTGSMDQNAANDEIPAGEDSVQEPAMDEPSFGEPSVEGPSVEEPSAEAQSGQAIPPQDRPHDYDVDEPRFDTQTGERLDRPKKKYPGVILTLAVTAAAAGAFIYAVLPGKLPSLGTVEEDDVETEIHLAVASAETEQAAEALAPQTETDMVSTEADADTGSSEPLLAAGPVREAQTESEPGAETEAETETEEDTGSASGKDKRDEKPEFKTEGVALSATLDVSDMVEEVMPGIVSVTCTNIRTVQDFFYGRRQIEQTDAGSGIIVEEDDDAYYIVTDAWVVEGADELTVGFSVSRDATEGLSDEDTLADASVISVDQETELAMLMVRKEDVNEVVRTLVKPSVIGDSDQLRVGERAIAIGNAMGYGLSVTEGIISALDRQMSSGAGVHSYIQTDASINYGNYGGALLNRDGEVIGINAGKISRDSGEGMGYAFPINPAKEAIGRMLGKDTPDEPETEEKKEESSGQVMLQVAEPETEEAASEKETSPETEEPLRETEEQPLPETEADTETEKHTEAPASQAGGGKLGVSVAEVSDEYSIIYRIPKGVYVVGVVDGGAASGAGLREDDVITSVNGEETPTVARLKEVLDSTSAGDEASVTYVRADEDGSYSEDSAVTVTVVLQ